MSRASSQGAAFQQFLSFDKLIGTKLIKGLYFLGIAVILLAALKFWRFICEIYLLFFRMSDDLRDIKNHQLGRDANNIDVNIGDE